jgi:DNA-binding beta-propeller fold protein YncE
MIRPFSYSLCLALLTVAASARAVPAVTGTVAIGPRPVAVAVDPTTHQVYVADTDLGAVVQFGGQQRAIAGTINIGGQPSSLAVDSAGRRLFVGNRDVVSAAVTLVDLTNGHTRAFVPAGHRVAGLAYDSQAAPPRLYVGDPDGQQLLVLDASSGSTLDQVPLGGVPTNVAVNEHTGEVAVTVQGPAPTLAVVNPDTSDVLQVPVTGGQPLHVAADPQTDKFFVTRDGLSPGLLVLRPGSSNFDNTIEIAAGVSGIGIDPRNSRIYVSHATANLMTVIDGSSGTPVAIVPTTDGANHLAVDIGSTPTHVYVADTVNGVLTILTDQ